MGRLSQEDIRQEVEAKGYSLVDASNYTNMESIITIRCPKGHCIQTSFANFRLPGFTCPQCDVSIKFINPTAVPPKKGFRIIAFDQATEHFGLSIFENGELIFFNLYTFVGNVTSRLAQIKNFVNNIVVKE